MRPKRSATLRRRNPKRRRRAARRAAKGRAVDGGVEFVVTGNLFRERQAAFVAPLDGL